MPRLQLSRRSVLRGVLGGIQLGVGLPMLEAMLGNKSAHAQAAASPKRFVTWFFGNGVLLNEWVPSATGANYALSPLLQPLAPYKKYLNVISGSQVHYYDNNMHANLPTVMLTGGSLSGGGDNATVTLPSIDKLAQDAIGGGKRTLHMKCSANGTGEPGTAFNFISHQGPNSPNRPELDPRKLYQSLFATTPVGSGPDLRAAMRKSYLDAVADDAKELMGQVGAEDRLRLQAHFDSIRALELRLDQLPMTQVCAKPTDPSTKLTNASFNSGGDNALTQIHQSHTDVLAMAMICDLSRVGTMTFTQPAANLTMHEINGPTDVSFHELCHRGQNRTAEMRAGLIYTMQRLANFCATLSAIKDPAGVSLLDSTAILVTSCVSEQTGGNHRNDDFPALLIGGTAAGLTAQGRHVRIAGQSSSRIGFTVLKALGSPAASFGSGATQSSNAIAEVLT